MICFRYCLKPEPKVIMPCGSTIILFPFALTAESKAWRSTPFAKPLTTTLSSSAAFFAIFSVKAKDFSLALREPTIAIDSSFNNDLFPFVYMTVGALNFRFFFNSLGYSSWVIGNMSYPWDIRSSTRKELFANWSLASSNWIFSVSFSPTMSQFEETSNKSIIDIGGTCW